MPHLRVHVSDNQRSLFSHRIFRFIAVLGVVGAVLSGGCSKTREWDVRVSLGSANGASVPGHVEVRAVPADEMRILASRVAEIQRAAVERAAQLRANDQLLDQLDKELGGLSPIGTVESGIVGLREEIRRRHSGVQSGGPEPGKTLGAMESVLFDEKTKGQEPDSSGHLRVRAEPDGWVIARVQQNAGGIQPALWVAPLLGSTATTLLFNEGRVIRTPEELMVSLKTAVPTNLARLEPVGAAAESNLVAWSGEVRAKVTGWMEESRRKVEGIRTSITGSHAAAGEALRIPIGTNELVIRWVPPGEFAMGSPVSEIDRDKDEVQHSVRLTHGFFLSEVECPQALWFGVMMTNRSSIRGADLPANQLTWNDAAEFCRRLTARHRSEGYLPADWRWDLPTEAQWEYACRAGTTGPFAGDLDAMAWHEKNAGNKPHAVGTRLANAWGLYDMHGNVMEWCRDWYASYPADLAIDPTGPATGALRIFRGGNRIYGPRRCRSAMRGSFSPGLRGDYLGFRPALVPDLQPPKAP